MKIMVTGSGGMLGTVLMPCLEARGHQAKGFSSPEFDITRYNQVLESVSSLKPELIVHCAAYTQVDQAEAEPEKAFLVNAYGAENVAVVCDHFDIPMLYVSTDYVFDGEKNHPYTTWDLTNPLSVYGKSKLGGEMAVQRHLNRFYIVRTSWLYGPGGKNFVDTISKLSLEKKTLRVVADQWGSPTCTLSLSETIADLIETERWGVYHATDGGVTNWCEFAKEIVKGSDVQVEAIETKDMPRPATRPKYSVLDKTVLIKTIGREMVPWQESLQTYLDMCKQGQPV